MLRFRTQGANTSQGNVETASNNYNSTSEVISKSQSRHFPYKNATLRGVWVKKTPLFERGRELYGFLQAHDLQHLIVRGEFEGLESLFLGLSQFDGLQLFHILFYDNRFP